MELTREIVLAEPPGKRLDSWIAEKVMGWEYKDAIYSWGEVLRPSQWIKPNGWPVDRVSCYSTDISAAWEVEEKMLEWGGCEIGCYGTRDKQWYEVTTIINGKTIKATSHTLPEAICKAALLAVMDDDQ